MAGTQNVQGINAIAIARGKEEPSNRNVLWLDENITGSFYKIIKCFNLESGKWELLSRSNLELLSDLKTVDGKGSGLISEGEYNMIMKNGVSYITDASNMSNSMYTSAFQSPLQSYVDYYGTYTYTDPTNENYKYSISKNKLGTGDYTTTTAYPLWNPEENKYVYTKVVENTTSFGGNLESNRDMMIEQLNQRYSLLKN